MKKHLRKIAILLTICMCLPLFAACDMNSLIGAMQQPSGGSTEVKDEKDETKAPEIQDNELPEGLELKLGKDNNSYRVEKYKGDAEEIEIPAVHNGFPVTEIGPRAFDNSKNLISVIIPDSVEVIADSAFKNCKNLEIVTIGEYESMLRKIENQVFHGCEMLDIIEFVGYEDTWESIEKAKDWDKNAGKKTDDKTYEMVFIDPTEPPVETQPEYTDVFGSETEEVSRPADETTVPDSGECKHEKITVPGIAPTCTEKGYLEGIMCAKCGLMLTVQMEIPAIGHIWDAGTTNSNASCGDTADVVYKCKTCGETRIETGEVVEHVWYEYAYTAPTCEVDGLASYRCARYGCSETKTEIIDAIGHEWGDALPSSDPTCIREGLMKFYCTRSGCSGYRNEYIPADPNAHSMKLTSKAPGFNTVGYEKHYKCEYCGYLTDLDGNAIDAPVEIAPTGSGVGDCEVFFNAEVLSTMPTANGAIIGKTVTITLSEDSSYVRYERIANFGDGVLPLITNPDKIVTGQYLVFKYRTDHMTHGNIFATTTQAHLTGRDSTYMYYVADEEWHIAIVDLSARITNGEISPNENGEYAIMAARIDHLDITASEGYMDFAWIAFCDNPADVAFAMTEEDAACCSHNLTDKMYDEHDGVYYSTCILCGAVMEDTLLLKVESSTQAYHVRGISVSSEYDDATSEDYIRYTITPEANDPYFYFLHGNKEVTGQYMVIKYRYNNDGNDGNLLYGYAATTESGKTSAYGTGDRLESNLGTLVDDGEWHYLVIDLYTSNQNAIGSTSYEPFFAPSADGTFSASYVRARISGGQLSDGSYTSLDVAYVGFADNMAAIENHIANN